MKHHILETASRTRTHCYPVLMRGGVSQASFQRRNFVNSTKNKKPWKQCPIILSGMHFAQSETDENVLGAAEAVVEACLHLQPLGLDHKFGPRGSVYAVDPTHPSSDSSISASHGMHTCYPCDARRESGPFRYECDVCLWWATSFFKEMEMFI